MGSKQLQHHRLIVENLTKTYSDGTQALGGISFKAREGLYGLLGPNGAGKTTLMNSIATLQEFDGGRIVFDGREVREDTAAFRSKLGYLPQDFGVYPRSSAYELMDLLARLKGIGPSSVRRRHIETLLEQVNLSEHADKAVESYSGGMRQRFGIAQAMIGDPQIIIVDEPTAGLDPTERNRFQRVLGEVGRGSVILLSTHIVEDIERLCKELVIINKGQVVAVGSPRDLCAKFEGRLWQGRVTQEQRETLQRSYKVISIRMAEGSETLVVESDSAIEDFEPKQPTLEDVYFSSVPGLN